MKKSKNTKTLWTLILLSILLALSGMMMVVSADGPSLSPNQFYGTVTINGDPAPAGTIISSYIDGELRGSLEIGTAGNYGYDLNYLSVNGSESDEGRTIVFKINGEVANENAVWREYEPPQKRDLSVGGEPPVGTTPAGTQETSPNDISSDGGATGGTGEISRPGPLPTVTPNGATSAPDEGTTPTSDEAHTPASTSTDDESGSGGSLPGFEAMFAITGMLAIAYLVRRRR
ncbi:PGF-CTERM sorting domain-containing protein [ANME-2 cluster archaeon]|nr:MAG: PGF-CTERM sorting domain-containing protein [ANME-2 cluster archaeon]